MSERHQPSASQEPLSQHDHITQTADLFLSAIDLADTLKVHATPTKLTDELTLPELLVSDALSLPAAWQDIAMPIRAFTITYQLAADDEKATMLLDAEFEDNWSSTLERSANVPDHIPFEGKTAQLEYQHGPANTADVEPYSAVVTTEEVEALLNSVLAYAPNSTITEIHDPQSLASVAEVRDIYRQSFNAASILDVRYDVSIESDTYEVHCIWEYNPEARKETLTTIQIKEVLRNDVEVIDGQPVNVFENLITLIELDDFRQQITYSIENNEDGEHEVSPEDVDKSLEETIELLERLKRTNLASVDELPLIEPLEDDVPGHDSYDAGNDFGSAAEDL